MAGGNGNGSEGRALPRRSSLDRYRLFVKAVQGLGKVRRFILSKTRRTYVEQAWERRRGECKRCGSCCAIMFKCPHLLDGNRCAIYDKRFEQCSHFPIDERDLRFLEHICGYHFVRKENGTASDSATDRP